MALPSVWPSVSVDDVGIPDPLISQLDIPPACAPVNASRPALRLATHDSGSGWLAMPFLRDSFIHCSTPIYPGAPTVHAGPHTAVRRIKLGSHDHGWKSELRKVGVGQRDGECGRISDPPRTLRTAGGLRRQILTDAPFAKLAEPRSSTLPLLPHHRPKPAA